MRTLQCLQIQAIYLALTLCREMPESLVCVTEQAQWIVELRLHMVRAQVRIFFCSSKKASLSLEAIISRSMSSSSLSMPSNCVSVLCPTYFRMVLWHGIRASPEKRMLPYHTRWDYFY